MNIFTKVYQKLREKLSPRKTKVEERKVEVRIGDVFIDNDWNDTLIKVVRINESATQVRYIFLKIDGRKIIDSDKHTISIDFLTTNYRKIFS